MRVTVLQRAMYLAIQEFIEECGYSPSVRQIGAMTNLRSSSTVHSRLMSLKTLGLIAFNPKEPRTLRIVAELPDDAKGDAA